MKEALRAQWSRARTEVHSATIKYGTFRAPFITPWVESARLLPLLEEQGLPAAPERIMDAILLLNEKSRPFARRFIPAEIHMEGNRIRTEYGNSTHAADDNHHYYFQRGNRSIYLYRRGQDSIAYDNPFTLRPIPDVRVLDAAEEFLRYPESGLLQIGQSARPNGMRSFHIVHEATGLPYYERRVNSSGELLREYLFLDYVTFPGDVAFPSWTVEFRHRQQKVSYACAIRLDEARFNVPLRSSDLAFSADAGVYIRDERTEGAPMSVTFSSPVPDVPFYVDNVLDFSNPPPPVPLKERSLPFRSVALWANGFLLLIFGLFLWRWRRPHRAPADT